MNILKTSLILYPSLPGGPRPKHIKTYINSKPIVPTYDMPKWLIRLAPVAFIVLAAFVWNFLIDLIEKLIKLIL